MELLKLKLNSKKLLLMKLLEIILASTGTQSIMLECVHIVYEIL